MCEICKRFYCPSSCPNFVSDSEALYICKKCGYKIREGDTAYRIDENTVWCEVCIQNAEFTAE